MNNTLVKNFALMGFLAVLSSPGVQAAGDMSRGANVFSEECSECHSVQAGKNKKGPSLFSILGRKAGSIQDFYYSPAMKDSGIVWTADKIEAYVAAPRKIVPGGKMKYDGLEDKAQQLDLIAYLSSLR
jgi:cytochrome c